MRRSDIDEVIKKTALDEFTETLSLLNLLTSIDCDQVSINFRIKLLQARHAEAFKALMSDIRPRWFKSAANMLNDERVRMVDVLVLDWSQQPIDIVCLRARLSLDSLLTHGNFPAELTDDEIAIFQQVQLNALVQKSFV